MSAGLIKHLKNKTEQDPNTAILLAQWEFDAKLVGKALENVASYYPHFSSHNASHSQQILVNIERLLGDNITELSATDTWLLLESAYWHDVGMLFNTDEVQEILKDKHFLEYVESLALDNSQDLHDFAKTFHEEGWQKALTKYDHPHKGIETYRQMVAEWFRRGHAHNSQRVVEDPFEKLGINSPRTELLPNRIYRYLGQICLSHGIGFEQVMTNLPFRQTGMGTENCHPRYVACLLRLGDLFDIDDNRFCPVMAKQVAHMPSLSKHHADKHSAIREFQLDHESISITAECSSQESYIQTQNWFGWIKEEIQNQMAQWKNIVPSRNFGLLPTINKLDVVMDSPKMLLDDKPMKFSLDEKSAIELLQGKNLYDDETNIYRELIQNAVDATYMRAWIEHGMREDAELKITDESHPFEENFQKILAKYPLSIDFKKIEDEADSDYAIWEFSITDKGAGISLNDLKYMQKIAGSSRNIEKQRLIKNMPVWMRPSGAFGIGLHSAFLLLENGRPEDNKIVLETKSIIDNQSYKVEMTSPISGNNGYCFIEKQNTGLDRDYGTKLTLNLRISRIKNPLYNISHQYDFITKPASDYLTVLNLYTNINYSSIPPSFHKVFNTKAKAIDNSSIFKSKESKITSWNRSFNLLFKVADSKIDALTSMIGRIRCFFKSQEVNDIRDSFIIPIDLDFYCFDAKESLQIDRNKWKKGFVDELSKNSFFERLLKNLLLNNSEALKGQIKNENIFYALEYYSNINANTEWKKMNFLPKNTRKHQKMESTISYIDFQKLNTFRVILDIYYEQYDFNDYDPEEDEFIVREFVNRTFFFRNFVKEWYLNGGKVTKYHENFEYYEYEHSAMVEDWRDVLVFEKVNNENNLIIKELQQYLEEKNSRVYFNDVDIGKLGLDKFNILCCYSKALRNLNGNCLNKMIILPFLKFHEDKKLIISTYNIDFLIDSVYEEIQKKNSIISREDVTNLYNELIEFVDTKMEVIPEWSKARERGQDFVPNDISQLEEALKK